MPLLQIRFYFDGSDIGKIGLHVGYISIGHQHDDMPECDVCDRYVILQT